MEAKLARVHELRVLERDVVFDPPKWGCKEHPGS
jgi:hypothetical protein